jgi:hypothetical protein
MLSLSTSIIKQFPATIGYMYLGVVMQVGWFFCIIISFAGLNSSGGVSPAVYSLVSFLGLFVSITLTNIMHVTTNGSVASWFFFAGSGTEVANPTNAAFKRAASKSLGSVALGSLIITIIRMLRSSLRSMRRNRNPFLMCCAYILLSILERVIEYITQYAFVYGRWCDRNKHVVFFLIVFLIVLCFFLSLVERVIEYITQYAFVYGRWCERTNI